jgi:hypothetical protein
VAGNNLKWKTEEVLQFHFDCRKASWNMLYSTDPSQNLMGPEPSLLVQEDLQWRRDFLGGWGDEGEFTSLRILSSLLVDNKHPD